MPVPPGHIVAQLADMHAPACTSTRQGQRVNLFARRQETCLQQHVSAHTYTPPDVSHTWACCPSLPLARLLPRFPCHHRQACSLLTNATVPVLDYNGRITTVPNPFVTYVSGSTAVQHPVGCVGGHGSATLAVCVCSLCGQAGGGGGGMDSKARGRAAWAQKACVPAVALHQMHTTWFWSGYCECGTKAETHVRHSLHSRPRTHHAMCVCGCSPTAGKHCTLCPLQRTWVPHPALAVCRLLQNGCTRDRSRVRSIFPSLGNQVAKFIASKRQRCQYTGSSIPS